MSGATYSHSKQPSYLSPYPPPPSTSLSHDDEFKASYDDLIDAGGSNYSRNAGHQLVNIDQANMNNAGQGGLTRNPSYPGQSSYSVNDSTADLAGGGGKRIDWGYPPTPPKKIEQQSFWSKWLPDSMACRLFVLAVVVQTIIDLAIEGELLLRFPDSPNSDNSDGRNAEAMRRDRMPIYLGIFAFAHVFQLVMAIDAVYARNTLQFLGLAIFNALFLAYAVVQIGEIRELSKQQEEGATTINVLTLTTIIPIVISIAELVFIGLGWKIYQEFGWKVYKFIGANRLMKKMYANYQVYQCLIKFDLFFFVGFSAQFISLVLSKNVDWEFYVTCAALPLSIILLIEGYLAARHESRWMMATFMSGCVGGLVYFVYKLYRVLAGKKTPQYEFFWKSLTIFSFLAIILLILTFISAVLVMANFGRGLKEQFAKNIEMEKHKRLVSQSVANGTPMTTIPNRMSIDL